MKCKKLLGLAIKSHKKLFFVILSQNPKSNTLNFTKIIKKIIKHRFRFLPHSRESVLPHKFCIQLYMSLCPFCPCSIGKGPSYIATFRDEQIAKTELKLIISNYKATFW